METKKLIFSKLNDRKERLDIFLVKSFTNELSRNSIQLLIKSGCVQEVIKGIIIQDPNYRINGYEKFLISNLNSNKDHLKPSNIKLDILYEDEDVIVINKQSGLIVHPSFSNKNNTLVNALINYCGLGSLSNIEGFNRPGIVHRLDKETTGLMVIAKNNDAHNNLKSQFVNRNLSRNYIALIYGSLPNNKGIFSNNIGRSLYNRKKMSVLKFGGKEAITRYLVKEVFNHPSQAKRSISLIECELETGRTHQIRVHLYYNGYPLVGDPLYKTKLLEKKIWPSWLWEFNRQALHAYNLRFLHPRTGCLKSFSITLPIDIQELIRKIKDYCCYNSNIENIENKVL